MRAWGQEVGRAGGQGAEVRTNTLPRSCNFENLNLPRKSIPCLTIKCIQ